MIITIIIILNIFNTRKNNDRDTNSDTHKNITKFMLTRNNSIDYFTGLNSELVKVVKTKDMYNKNTRTYIIDNLKPNTILVIVDDPYSSCDLSNKNIDNFLDNKNIVLCIVTDWFDTDHPKLFLYPIGLESKMFDNKFLSEKYIKYSRNHKKATNKILCNAHLKIYENPKSGYRNDRQDMLNKLQNSPHIDFWKKHSSQSEMIERTQDYMYNLCPEGNGLDTHRFYESYGLGVIPIIRKGPLYKLHSQFPGVKIVNDWSEVNNLQFNNNIKLDPEYITLGHWLYESLRPRCKIVTFFTGNLCNEWKNFVYTVKKQGLQDLLITFVLDNDALQCVKNENLIADTTYINSNITKEANFGTKEFNIVTKIKLKVILDILKKDYFVFYFDSDIVLLGNPIREYFNYQPKHIYMQSDNCHFNIPSTNYCAGIIFVVPCENTKKFFTFAINKLTTILQTQNISDQEIINMMVKNNNKNIGTLCPYDFPNGCRYFNYREKCSKNPILVHNNYIVGLDAKINRFKKHNLWFV